MTRPAGRVPVHFPAIVKPRAAYIIARDYGSDLEKRGHAFIAAGHVDVGQELLDALAYMAHVGSAWMAAHRAATSEAGSAEVPTGPSRAESEPHDGVAAVSGLTTGEVAKVLKVSDRQVRNMVGEQLLATKVGGRWLVDEVSVAKHLETRRSAG